MPPPPRYRQPLLCGNPPSETIGNYRLGDRFGSISASYVRFINDKRSNDNLLMAQTFAQCTTSEIAAKPFAVMHVNPAGRQIDSTNEVVLYEVVEMAMTVANFVGTHAQRTDDGCLLHCFPRPNLGGGRAFSGKAVQMSQNTHSLPVTDVDNNAIYTPNYYAIAARFNRLINYVKYKDRDNTPILLCYEDNFEALDDFLYNLQQRGNAREVKVVFVESFMMALHQFWHDRLVDETAPTFARLLSITRSSSDFLGAGPSSFDTCCEHNEMENLECSQRYILILIYAMMRWWQERAGVMVNVHLSQALDVITSGELHTRFFWQFVKNEAPVENNYDRQKQLVAFDREAASAATCPINMRYLVNSRAVFVERDGRLTEVDPAEPTPSGRYFTSNNAPAPREHAQIGDDEEW